MGADWNITKMTYVRKNGSCERDRLTIQIQDIQDLRRDPQINYP